MHRERRSMYSMGTNRMGKCLVIGGSGWLGSFIVNELLQLSRTPHADISVYSIDIKKPSKDMEILHSGEVFEMCDIRNDDAVYDVICRINPAVVFLVAAVIDLRQYPSTLLADVNISGAVNVLNALHSLSSSSRRFLVYTSTLDVISGKHGAGGGDELVPYADDSSSNFYKKSKIIAERNVLSSNCSSLRTVSLRPGHLYGPFDPILLIAANTPVAIGPASARMSFTYIENCAKAHIRAAGRLQWEANLESGALTDDLVLSGNPLFICDIDVNFSDMYKDLSNRRRSTIRIPTFVIEFIIILCDLVGLFCYQLFKVRLQHPVTGMNSAVLEACGDHTVNSSKAKKLLGYFYDAGNSDELGALVSVEEAIKRTQTWARIGK